jgi:RNA recognition motif-containing protein
MNIFVGNLPRDITEDDLREAFGAFGKVNTVSVIKDKFTGEPRGSGSSRCRTRTKARLRSPE